MQLVKTFGFLTLLSFAIITTACTPIKEVRGNLVNQKTINSLEVGTTNQKTALELLGTPMSTSTFDSRTWYYIGQKTEQYGVYQTEVVEQQVIALEFNDEGVLEKIDMLDENDGLDIEPSSKETESSGRQFTILQQLIGNVGRFNKSTTSKNAQ